MRSAVVLIVCASWGLLGWVLPALGSDNAHISVSLAKRVSRLESGLRSTQREVRSLRSQIQTRGPVRFTRVSAPVTEIAPGVVPHWLQGQTSCPADTAVTGGGVRWNGTHGDQPRLQSSAPEGNGWRGVIELTAVSAATTVAVYAICASS
jgi:hypothetical protein